MKQRVSVITLGVSDLPRARTFYEALGWATGAEPGDDVVFFQTGDMVVALWDRGRLVEDSCAAAASWRTDVAITRPRHSAAKLSPRRKLAG